ncbi:ROK family transcriptional regulator [Streptomyces fructofermentans]|uniref:Transcriptional regulator n=1 Tax=Streptomyces fructofermentans TaxID=152141 RepID=A0A918NR29_9ACTN|nr:ROK family transcriptional regulator [Streptomyces fructofermentans]GGX89506.1 transcriptional regulator [Streptomyces fructofermentans]
MAGIGAGGGASGVNLVALRSHNAALLLELLRRAGRAGVSRLELAERTGLTPQAVSKITARLREDGLVTEAGRQASTGGKPRTVLRLVPEAGHAVGLQLDRDELRAVLVDLTGAVVGEGRTGLDLGAGSDAVLDVVEAEVRRLVAGAGAGPRGGSGVDAVEPGGSEGRTDGAGTGPVPDARPPVPPSAPAPSPSPEYAGPGPGPAVLGVGVAMPGPLDHTHGVLHRVTGFPEWDGFPLRNALARRLGVPVVLDKDTNAAALGLAVGGEAGAFAYLHLGTGLGAGLVLGGAVHRGARTGAGEFGHQVIQLDGPSCSCGNRGCIEALCLTAVARGDVDEAARVLGEGAANLVGLLDIDLVLLGGRTVDADPARFVRGVGAVLDALAEREGVSSPVPVRVASGGARAVAEGAAQLLLAPLFGRAEG